MDNPRASVRQALTTMKISYVSGEHVPCREANGVHVTRMGQAFADHLPNWRHALEQLKDCGTRSRLGSDSRLKLEKKFSWRFAADAPLGLEFRNNG